MRKLPLLLSFIFFIGQAKSQSLINTTGSTISNSAFIYEYSIGEIGIITISGNNSAFAHLTQGLLQPGVKNLNPTCEEVNNPIHFFPNPVNHYLSVVPAVGDWITSYRIYSSDGKLVRVANFISNQVDMSNLPGGYYLIKFLPGCNNNFRTIKVLKQ